MRKMSICVVLLLCVLQGGYMAGIKEAIRKTIPSDTDLARVMEGQTGPVQIRQQGWDPDRERFTTISERITPSTTGRYDHSYVARDLQFPTADKAAIPSLSGELDTLEHLRGVPFQDTRTNVQKLDDKQILIDQGVAPYEYKRNKFVTPTVTPRDRTDATYADMKARYK